MIYGKTTQQIDAQRNRWTRWFAWYPVQLDDGRRAWLQWVEYRHEGHWSGDDCHYRTV